MQYDIWKFISIISFALLLGLSIGYPEIFALIACIGIIAWQIFRIKLLQKWIDNPLKNPLAETSGQFYLLHRSINRIKTSNSKRKRQLSALLSQFRKAVGTLPDTIVLIDEFGKIEWANSNAKELLNIRWPEDVGVRFCDLIRHPEVVAYIGSVKHKENNARQGVVFNAQNNREQTLNLKCVRYTDELRMIIVRDVSRLMNINKMHTDFVANVSHELKTPLTVLRGYLEILQDSQDLPSSFEKPLTQMNLQSARMELIVSDLLYLAKLEESQTTMVNERVDVSHLVTTIIESVQPLLEEKRHKLKLEIDHKTQLLGSSSELHSAFSNLITNAIKYTPNHGIVGVYWKRDQRGVVFSVKDNGHGIGQQHLKRLTERFYRVDSDRSREGGGTGLGLAIVKHVMQRHGGKVDVLSTLGTGSEFRCLFSQSQIANNESSTIEASTDAAN